MRGLLQVSASTGLAAMLLGACQSVPPADAAKGDVRAATEAWAAALNACAVDRVTALYAPEAYVWPTTMREIAKSPEQIHRYFERVCATSKPQTTVNEHNVRTFGDMAVNTGAYTFTVARDGKPLAIPARFSLVYQRVGGKWLIVDHHSSGMPAAPR